MPTGAHLLDPVAAQYGTTYARGSLETTGKGGLVPNESVGANDVTLPIAMLPNALTGGYLYAYVDDFYDRIHLIPSLLNFGGVSSRQTKNFRFWSAYRSTRTLDTILLTDFDGITLTGISVSDVFAPLEVKTGQIEISLVGPQEIAGVATFTLDNGGEAALSIIGSRGGSAVFMPDWTAPLSQEIEFKTTISSSLSNYEQRQAERYEPRVKLAYPYAAFDGGKLVSESALREYLRTKAHLQGSGLIWTDFVRTTAAIPANTDLIDVDMFFSWLEAGATIAIYDPNTNVPVLANVNAIDTGLGQIEVLGGMAFDIPEGAKIYRFESLWFDMPSSVTFETRKVSKANISFLIDPASLVYDVPPAAPKTLAGREVFDTPENWAETPSLSFERVGRSLDYGVGVFQRKSDADYTTETLALAFVGKTRNEAILLRDVFIRARGRQGEFWRPVFTDDLEVKTIPVVGATTLVMQGSYVGTTYLTSKMHRGVRFTLADGTTEDYTLVSMSSNDVTDETYFELGEPWRDVGTVDNIVKSSWLYVWRFASDTLVIEWVTDEVARIQMNILSLPVEDAE